ncbi:LysR family transcriptional regulator [Aureimonas ureilytica]|uniref:LysR family transcriptional regulator n=1 Tax=Aureimonas ureilytica TaxID=401562 RepID=UPI0009EB278E|nr:LysR family transcriptional regulator [Aureimonas ureilytica]
MNAYWSDRRRPIYESKQLIYFVSACKHGSFRKAAAALNINQSTLSRRILGIEDMAGKKLLSRSIHGVKPTTDGERFLLRAELALDIIAKIDC